MYSWNNERFRIIGMHIDSRKQAFKYKISILVWLLNLFIIIGRSHLLSFVNLL